MKLKVTRTFTVVYESNMDTYPGMTVEQAIEYEKNLDNEEVMELIDSISLHLVKVEAEVVDG
jgi:hypothetical protein